MEWKLSSLLIAVLFGPTSPAPVIWSSPPFPSLSRINQSVARHPGAERSISAILKLQVSVGTVVEGADPPMLKQL